MEQLIPYGRQMISDEDILAVADVLRSDFLTQGPAVPAFERAVAAEVGARHGVAMNSATSALHVACLALGVGPGDIVWTSPVTFVASANAAIYCGARVDFVDIDERTYNMCAQKLGAKLEKAAAMGALPKVIIPVHLTGQSCDMPAIRALASRYGIKLIEDASHAIGGRYRSVPVGSCKHSDITVFSFHPVKIVTTGEGGMALTNCDDVADRMRMLRSHGITRDPSLIERTDPEPWYYEQQILGFNYRMTDMAAALGVTQLQRLGEFVGRRRDIAARYDEALADLPVMVPWQDPDAASAWHLYVVRVDPARAALGHREVFEHLRARGIGVNLHYMPVYLQPYYRKLGFRPGYCAAAEKYYAEAISLPIHPSLTAGQQTHVIAALREAVCPEAAIGD